MNYYSQGFRAVFPVISGIIPFGAVMGSSFAEAKLSFPQALFMNTTVYAGAAQLASIDLMKLNAAVVVVVGTGLVINLRFLLYSAALSPYLADAKPRIKFLCAFTLTDQSYATMSANQDRFKTNAEGTSFYIGTAVCMMLAWNSSVIAGYIFGNFAPSYLSLEFAIPLSFVALLVPTLKTRNHYLIAVFSSLLSLLCFHFPLKTGMLVSALLSIGAAWVMIRRRKTS